MKKITHFYSLSSHWQHNFAEEMGAKVIDDKMIIIPQTLGVGHIYFIEVTKGISALFTDYTLSSPLRISKVSSEEEFYIFHYNPSYYSHSECQAGKTSNYNFSILSNYVENIWEPVINERIFGFSLFIEKRKMQKFVGEMQNSEILNKKLNSKNGYYNDRIDSNSLVLLFSLKEKSMFDASFEYYLKGVSYKLLANFLSHNVDLTLKKT